VFLVGFTWIYLDLLGFAWIGARKYRYFAPAHPKNERCGLRRAAEVRRNPSGVPATLSAFRFPLFIFILPSSFGSPPGGLDLV
jgi:hypothetical protein